MYVAYWNLKESPFLTAFDRRYFYSGTHHGEAIARFRFLTENGRLAGLLVGPIGVGKTTVINEVARGAQKTASDTLTVAAPPDGALALINHLFSRLGIVNAAYASFADALLDVPFRVACCQEKLKRMVLCIDNAHNLTDAQGLELLRLLVDLQYRSGRTQAEQPLFSLLLAGATSLADAIRGHTAMRERVQLFYTLPMLSSQESVAYVQQHMRAAGGDIWVFTEDALEALCVYGKGIPRRINLLCDTALMLGFAAKAERVSGEIITQAANEAGMTALPAFKTQPESEA